MKAAPVVLTGEEREAAGGADSGGAMSVGKAHSPTGETVDIRSLDLGFGVPVGNIGHAHVIGVEDDDVWAAFSRKSNMREEGENADGLFEHVDY